MNFECLRFKDDNGDSYGEWEETTVKDVTHVNPRSTNLANTFQYLDLGSVKSGSVVETRIIEKLDAPSRAQRILEKEDILFQAVRPYQQNNYRMNTVSDIQVVASTGYIQLRPKSKISSLFLYYVLHTKQVQNQVRDLCTGSNYPAINSTDLASTTISIPSLPEQEKIASFLSTLDKRIELQSKKVDLLSEQKIGYAQKIFSRELVFKDDNGDSYGEWKKDLLGNLARIRTGKLNANQMSLTGTYKFFTCAKETYMTDTYAFDTEALMISGNGNIGYTHYYKGKFNAYQRTYVLDNFTANIKYVQAFLDTYLKDRVMTNRNVGSMPYIVLSVLSEMPISIPSPHEQEKIANLLSTFDESIILEKRKLELLKEQKQGYMQRLFA
jgi:type I restriction enzyme S subunit